MGHLLRHRRPSIRSALTTKRRTVLGGFDRVVSIGARDFPGANAGYARLCALLAKLAPG
jgi:hypothetical protein